MINKYIFKISAGVIRYLIPIGNIVLIEEDGTQHYIGNSTGKKIEVRFLKNISVLKILLRPRMYIAEEFCLKNIDIDIAQLNAFISTLFENEATQHRYLNWLSLYTRRLIYWIGSLLFDSSARSNIEYHYDIGNDFYASFLDQSRSYSCAIFDEQHNTLESAQLNKIRKVVLRAGVTGDDKVLEIGCGWGALARELSKVTSKPVTALTLSNEQFDHMRQISIDENLDINCLLEDYCDHAKVSQHVYDRIISVGMFEHAGIGRLATFFKNMDSMVTDDGRVFVHTIVRNTAGVTNPWIRKRIFPGGYIAEHQELIKAAESQGLELDSEYIVCANNYIGTLAEWSNRLKNNFDTELQKAYGAETYRAFQFYFAGSQAAFQHQGMYIGQFVFRKTAR